MFGNVGNNNMNTKSINTKIRTMYSDLSCLQLSYWNENVSIKINPLKDKTPDGLRTYDYNRRANTALTVDKCLTLTKNIEERIFPEIEKVRSGGILEKRISTGVMVGSHGSAIFIEYNYDENNIPSVYFTVYTNIDPTTFKAPAEGVFRYKFSKVTSLDSYNPETGEKIESIIEAEFLFLYNVLKNVAMTFGLTAHSINVDNDYRASIANRTNNRTGNFNSQGSYQNTSNYSAPVSEFNDNTFPFDQ